MKGRPVALWWQSPRWRAALIVGASALLGATSQGQPVPPRATEPPAAAAFFQPPSIDSAKLSPSGRWLAMNTGIAAKRIGLVIADLQKPGDIKPLVRFDHADIASFHWVGDERLIFSVRDTRLGSAEQDFGPGLYSIRRDGSMLRELIMSGGFRRGHALPLGPNHGLIHIPAGGGPEIIVGATTYNRGRIDAVNAKRLNVDTGRATSLSIGRPLHAKTWLFDRAGEPRVITASDLGRTTVHWRPPGQVAWQVLAEFDSLQPAFVARYIDADNRLYVTQNVGAGGHAVLKRFDVERRVPEPDALVSTPGFDFDGDLVVEDTAGKVWGVRARTDAETTVWFDDRLKSLQAEADARLPGRINRLDCRRCGDPDMTVLVHSWSDQDPGQYWVYKSADTSWVQAGAARPDIVPQAMATLAFHRIRARDGRDLPVWVTRPRVTGSKAPPPAVVLVHGGPWVRGGDWSFRPWSQFLASRGYVVIEPEFRGSTGYGDAHFRAGWKQWGLAMQDDLADALLWARQQGLADPEKACLAGASYGGYATLMGLVKQPTLFRCGIAWLAVTDPRLLFEWQFGTDVSDEARQIEMPRMIGDPVADAEALTAASPLARAADIKAPLLLAFGMKDRRVPLIHGTRLRDALTALGRPPEFVSYPGEGHGGWKLEHQVDFAERMERFLNVNLRGVPP